MKTNIFALILFVGIFPQLEGMGSPSSTPIEQSQSKELQIINVSDQKIYYTYKHRGEEPVNGALDPKEYATVKRAEHLELIKVVPYGQWKGYLSRDVLTAGYLPADNLAFRVLSNISEDRGLGVTLIINPGGQSFVGKGFFGTIVSQFVPYHIEITSAPLGRIKLYIKKRIENPLQYFIDERFPQVGKAWDRKTTIYPRYFLSVGENASERDIDAAYQMEMERIMQLKHDAPAEKLVYFAQVIEFVEAAYNALKMKTSDAFNILVQEYLNFEIPTAF